jgi:excisionase family DNA binding protein
MNSVESQTISVDECAEVLSISRGACYAAARRGEIPVIRIGGRVLVPKPALEKMLVEAGKKEVDK